jgi:hypothetical protein
MINGKVVNWEACLIVSQLIEFHVNTIGDYCIGIRFIHNTDQLYMN